MLTFLTPKCYKLSSYDSSCSIPVTENVSGGKVLPAKVAPNKSKSAKKRARQSEKRSLRNRSVKNMFRTLSKKVETDVKSEDSDGAREALNKAITCIDKAASKGILHRNTASRKVSRLSRLVNSRLRSEAT